MRHAEYVLAAEFDFALLNAARRLRHQPHHGKRGNALAAARLAHDAERLFFPHVKRQAAHGAAHALVRVKGDVEVSAGEAIGHGGIYLC